MTVKQNWLIRDFRIIWAIFVFTLALAISTVAQNLDAGRQQDTGFQSGFSYAPSQFESINTTNGNVLYALPLGNLPAGRGAATAGISLNYNSKIMRTRIETTLDQSNNNVPQLFLGRKPGIRMAIRV